MIGRLTVVGVGLIGGSLALAVRERGLAREVIGCGRSRRNLDVALARGAVDRVTTTPEEAALGADLLVLAAPVASCGGLAARLAPHAAPGAILTDVGSVKASVVRAMERAWPDAGRVVGAHPIAGSDRSGAAAADASLFVGRRCVLTPTERTDATALQHVTDLWRGVGAVVETMTPARHDEILAWVSHLPHAVAYALAEAVGRKHGRLGVLDYLGSGFRDTTRIARSSPELWRDVLLDNAAGLADALRGFRGALEEIEQAIRTGDGQALERLLAAARARLPEDHES